MLLHHAPWKQVRIRTTSVPWISDKIRYKMNRRYKLFKKAINTKCPLLWQEFKRARNEVTSALRLDKALTRLRIPPYIGRCLKKQQILLNRRP